jgi:hypothetical protein
MQRCPHCGSDLTSGMTPDRTGLETDGPATAARLVTCPDCEGPIDGYSVG